MSEPPSPASPDRSSVRYLLSPGDQIVRVNEEWDRFAIDADAAHLRGPVILGRSLWDYITESAVVDIYRALLASARAGDTITVPFRCDSPTVLRMMRMQLVPLPQGFVECRSQVEAEHVTPEIRLWDPAAPRSQELLVACSWCKRLRVSADWLEPAHAVEVLRLFLKPVLPRISHSVCPPCQERLLDTVD